MVITHNNIEDYTLDERLDLESAYNALETIAQAGTLTIDETRIRVAYIRLLREENFRISQTNVKAPKVPKEPKEPKIPGTRTRRIAAPKDDSIAKASALLFRQIRGDKLTEEEEAFLASKVVLPPAP